MPPHRHSPASSADSRILDIDTAHSSTTTYATANEFPKPAGTTVSNIRIETEPLISPALSGFTFNLDPEPQSTVAQETHIDTSFPELSAISFSDPFAISFSKPLPYAVSRPPTRPIRSGTMSSEESGAVTRSESTAKRVDYFNRAFSNGDGKESARERVQKESPIIAELRTNVIIKDEYTAITSLSQHLSERYRRPESAIMITVSHSTCLMMGGSFEPAYILDITAIPSEVQPTTNKRNAYLIQCFVAEVLHVSSSRGVVRFRGLEEQNIATNGTTIQGDIERAEKDAIAAAAKEEPGLIRSLTSKSSRMSMIGDKRKSMGAHTVSENRKSMGAHITRADSRKSTVETIPEKKERRKSIAEAFSEKKERRKSIIETFSEKKERRKSLINVSENRKSLVKSSAGERKSIFMDGKDTVIQTIERKFSTRSLRSVKSLKDSISPPIPTEFPADLLPSPTSIQFSMTGSPKDSHFPDLPKIHRLSPLHHLGRSSPTAKDRGSTLPQPPPSPSPLSQNPPNSFAPQLPPLTPSPSPPQTQRGTEKEPMVTSATRRPQSSHGGQTSPRPQSARKNLSNITGLAGAIPSPPPIPDENLLDVSVHGTGLRHKLSKRKSFVSLFQRKPSDVKA